MRGDAGSAAFRVARAGAGVSEREHTRGGSRCKQGPPCRARGEDRELGRVSCPSRRVRRRRRGGRRGPRGRVPLLHRRGRRSRRCCMRAVRSRHRKAGGRCRRCRRRRSPRWR
ncbi:MAG: hypothetical protein EA398_14340 [Deltaproteobacteria bacterium]|nr:MAG: hypothetical protein EA398_14340 [Deltaproteobacteria bacterium]